VRFRQRLPRKGGCARPVEWWVSTPRTSRVGGPYLNAEHFSRVHLLIEELDDSSKLRRKLIGDEYESKSFRLEGRDRQSENREALEVVDVVGRECRTGANGRSCDHAIRQRASTTSGSVEQLRRQSGIECLERDRLADQFGGIFDRRLRDWATQVFGPCNRRYPNSLGAGQPASNGAILPGAALASTNEEVGIEVYHTRRLEAAAFRARTSLGACVTLPGSGHCLGQS
jgi:hypothetical protein